MSVTGPEFVRAVRGPILLIVLGLLFVADYFGSYPFYRTWPVLLIAYGALKLIERIVPHGDAGAPAGGSL